MTEKPIEISGLIGPRLFAFVAPETGLEMISWVVNGVAERGPRLQLGPAIWTIVINQKTLIPIHPHHFHFGLN